LTNDSLNGTSPVLLADVNLTQVSTTNAGVTLDVTDGSVDVAAGTAAGSYTVTYQICDTLNPTVCDTATVSVPVVTIDAVNDSGSMVNGTLGGISLANVLTNDSLNGTSPVLIANVNLTQVSTTNAGVTLDVVDGSVDVAAGTAAGTYIVTYQICDKLNPTVCDTATVSVPVVTIDAVNDSGSTVNGTTGGTSLANVLTNDSLNGTSPVLIADVNLTQVSTTNAGVTLDLTDGSVDVAAGTAAGSYTVTYQICDKLNPTVCDTATVSVPVVTIDAVNDSGSTINGTTGGTSLANVLTNDSLNGTSPVLLADVNLAQVSTTNAGVTLDVTDGSVDVAAGTAAGSYTVTYQICDKLNPTVCDTATVSVPVVTISPTMTVAKSSITSSLSAPATVNYSYLVTNTGNVSLSGISLSDDNDNNDMNCPATTLAVGANMTCTATHTFSQAELDAGGTLDNNVTASSNEAPDATDSLSIPITQTAAMTLTKSITSGDPYNSVGDVINYSFLVQNTGNVSLAGPVTVSDDKSTNESCPNVNTVGNLDGNLNPGESITCTATYTIVLADLNAGSVTNIASASAASATSNTDTQTANSIGIFDPPSGIKTFTEAGLPQLEFRMVWINGDIANAGSPINVQVTDNIPTGTTYVAGSIICEPRGSSSNAGAATAPLNTLGVVPNSFCGYDSSTIPARIQWQGTIGADNGILATDPNAEANAANEVVITFRVTVDNGVNQVFNQGFSITDVDSDGVFQSIPQSTFVTSNLVVWNRSVSADPGDDGVSLPKHLPATGFEPNVFTILREQPARKIYAATELSVEIPKLGIKMPIVGVPLVGGDWDVSWLTMQAGWLNGTAYPTWNGNSVLTGHVYDANGKPGPFVNLGDLKSGDKIIIHSNGYIYIYKVRENLVVKPDDTSPLKHEANPWLTLITCKTYNQDTNTYSNRVAVRAELASIEKDTRPNTPDKRQ